MRSRLAWFVGGLGFAAAVVRYLRRAEPPAPVVAPLPPAPAPPVSAPAPEPEPEPTEPDPRAEELRRRLEESRALVMEREEFESGETPVDHAEAPRVAEGTDPEERRRRVHEEGQTAIEKMRHT